MSRGLRSPLAGDIAFSVLLSILAAASAAGLTGSNAGDPRSGVTAAIAVLVMVTPVALARRYPVAMSVVLGAGALVNWLAIGPLVRCGTALPAVFYLGFVLGMRRPRWRSLLLGAAGLVLDLIAQSLSDPRLGTGVLRYMVPITLGFGVAGAVWRYRRATVARLRVETARLREQRDANARLAVAADRDRIASDISGFLHAGVEKIAAAAAVGSRELDREPEQAELAFIDIQRTGRAALTQMREVLSDLDGGPLSAAGEMLARLDRLAARASEGRVRLRVEGDPRLLLPSVELSAYRIVERLLDALEDRSAAGPEIVVRFGSAELLLTVAGTGRQASKDRVAVAVAKERAAVHGGTLQSSLRHGRRTTVVRLPLAVVHV